jgi:hypothetical protein
MPVAILSVPHGNAQLGSGRRIAFRTLLTRKEEKFFGSFFQKRTFFLPRHLRHGIAV